MKGPQFFSLIHENRNEDVLISTFSKLQNHKLLGLCSSVCKFWKSVAEIEELWGNLCKHLWSTKIYIPNEFVSLHTSRQSKEAFKNSLIDSKRIEIRIDELTSFTFNFRFKEIAGGYWIDQDPYWQRQDPIKVSFRADGKVTGFPWDVLDIKWRFVDDTGCTCSGTSPFVAVSVNERNVPKYVVARHSNWGFVLQASPRRSAPLAADQRIKRHA